jgi:hypothetical protein
MTTTETPGRSPQVDMHRRKMLVRLASNEPRLAIRQDPDVPGGFIVNDPEMPDAIEQVDPGGACACRAYGISGRCIHAATVELHHGRLT